MAANHGLSGLMWSRAEPKAEEPLTIEKLFHRHADDVYRIVSRLLGPGADRADVEDLGQQVFMALHVALPKYRGESKVSTWIYGITSRLVYRELRQRGRHRRMVKKLEQTALAGHAFNAPTQEVRLELTEVWRYLMKLHPKKRIVFVLHELEGLSGREISEALGIKEPTVHTRLFYARKALMRALEARR